MCTSHYNGKVPAALRRRIGQFSVVGFDGLAFADRLDMKKIAGSTMRERAVVAGR